jgi:hypothetical protein
MPTPEFETLLYAAAGPVATITLNRPDQLNTIIPPMPDEIEAGIPIGIIPGAPGAGGLGAGDAPVGGFGDVDSAPVDGATGDGVVKPPAAGTVWPPSPIPPPVGRSSGSPSAGSGLEAGSPPSGDESQDLGDVNPDRPCMPACINDCDALVAAPTRPPSSPATWPAVCGGGGSAPAGTPGWPSSVAVSPAPPWSASDAPVLGSSSSPAVVASVAR